MDSWDTRIIYRIVNFFYWKIRQQRNWYFSIADQMKTSSRNPMVLLWYLEFGSFSKREKKKIWN